MKKKDILKAVQDIVWMARRYAHGRMTYAPSMFNDAYDVLRDYLGKEIDTKRDQVVGTFPYAQYGEVNKYNVSAFKTNKYVDDVNPKNAPFTCFEKWEQEVVAKKIKKQLIKEIKDEQRKHGKVTKKISRII